MPQACWQAATDGTYWLDVALGSLELSLLIDTGFVDAHQRIGFYLEPNPYDQLRQSGAFAQFFTAFPADSGPGGLPSGPPPTPSSDVFQLGLVLAELFTGKNPLAMIQGDNFAAPIELASLDAIPGELGEPIRHLLQQMLTVERDA